MFGYPPDWLTGDALTTWYNERYRDRSELCLTLIPSTYEALYAEILHTESSNYVARAEAGLSIRDTNRVAFASVEYDNKRNVFQFELYSPSEEPILIDLFGREHLEPWDSWSYLGSIEATSRLTSSEVNGSWNSYFLQASRGDMDSDGDGIPDGLEILLFHTDPQLWDSCGDGLSDWLKLYRYGLDPLERDSDGDGYEDDEELFSGSNPCAFTEGAGESIRYDYDDDDNLVHCYSGAGQGAVTKNLSPAGNPESVHHRRTRP